MRCDSCGSEMVVRYYLGRRGGVHVERKPTVYVCPRCGSKVSLTSMGRKGKSAPF